jgi:hypothetical protein
MTKEFIPYEQSLALKELGFDEKCLSYPISSTDASGRTWTSVLVAPLYQQAFRWFREKYNFCSWVYQVDNSKYFFSILEEGRYLDTNNKKRNSYEEAELECLKRLIEIVKNK